MHLSTVSTDGLHSKSIIEQQSDSEQFFDFYSSNKSLLIKVDLSRDGVIFFPEFCKVILRKFREDNVEVFGPYMFKVRGSVILKLSSFTKKTTHFANYYRTFLYDIPQQKFHFDNFRPCVEVIVMRILQRHQCKTEEPQGST